MLRVTFAYCYAECRYTECHYAECRYTECHGIGLKSGRLGGTFTI